MDDNDELWESINKNFFEYWKIEGDELCKMHASNLLFPFHKFCWAFQDCQTLLEQCPYSTKTFRELHELKMRLLPFFLKFIRNEKRELFDLPYDDPFSLVRGEKRLIEIIEREKKLYNQE